MVLGALVDLGLPLEYLHKELNHLSLPPFEIKMIHLDKAGLPATKVDVFVKEKGLVRYFSNIASLITKSKLKKSIIDTSLKNSSPG